MDTPPPDPAKLLSAWMDWERGEAAPGKTIADLKRGGLRTLLEELVMSTAEVDSAAGDGPPG
ncbi:MAG TPA: hypothetical protein VGI06_07550 [Acidimicrobiales bacterium]